MRHIIITVGSHILTAIACLGLAVCIVDQPSLFDEQPAVVSK